MGVFQKKKPGTFVQGDLKLLINGIAIACEIKMPGDKLRPDQIKYKESYERAGGIYLIVRSFEEFLNFYNSMT